MAVRISWLYPDPGTAGGQSREDTRLSPIGTMWPTGTMTTRSGLIPGGSPMALSGSGMTATIGLGRAVVQGTSAQGAYAAAVTVPHAVTHDPGHASLARIDVIALRVYDTVYDSSGQSIGDIVIVKGTEAGSPAVPAMPTVTTMPLWRITVPAGASAGTGGLTWGGATDMRTYTVAAGGILPVDASNANGSYVGQVRIISGRLHQWTGSAWAEFALPSAVDPSTWGAWTAYTPTWTGLTTLGSATSTGRSARTGRMINMEVTLTWGTGSVLGTGAVRISLPESPAAVTATHSWTGSGTLRPAGGGAWIPIVAVLDGAASTIALFRQRTSDLGLVSIGTDAPSWASGATIRASLTYEAAA